MDRFEPHFDSPDEECDAAFDASAALDDTAHGNPPPSPIGQDERRMQVRAYNHWVADLGDNDLPSIELLEPEDLTDFGPYCVLLDFSTGSGTPSLPFVGAKLLAECRAQDAIDDLRDVPAGSLLARVAENYGRVLEAQGPVSFEAEALNAQGRAVAYRGVLLPYSSDFDTIDFVLAVVNWKELADPATASALLDEIDAARVTPNAPANVVPFVPAKSQAPALPAEQSADDESDSAPPAWSSPSVLGFALDSRHEADRCERDAADIPDLPMPSFGAHDEDMPVTDRTSSYNSDPKRERGLDALGNPVGQTGPTRDAEHAPTSIAAEYGLPEWDEDEDIEDDVDDVVNPLADIDLNSRLMSLVNAGTRHKKTIDLSSLTDALTSSDEDEEDARPLFKPKAPPVDTLLTPEIYDEDEDDEREDEVAAIWEEEAGDSDSESADEVAEHADGSADEFAEQDDLAVSIASEASLVPADIDIASAEPIAAHIVDEGGREEPAFDTASEDDAGEAVFELPSLAAAKADVPAKQDGDVFDLAGFATIEEDGESAAGEADIASDITTFDDTGSEEDDAGWAPGLAGMVEEAMRAHGGGSLIATSLQIIETQDEEQVDNETPQDTVNDDPISEEAAWDDEPLVLSTLAPDAPDEPDAAGDNEPQSLHGLLAAVNELAEAAQTTRDADRRALYEAVGRAFDASIKAVIASEARPAAPVTPLPVADLAPTGPDLALVLVRRHRNGDIEVVGEVPHDDGLLASAEQRLASRAARFG